MCVTSPSSGLVFFSVATKSSEKRSFFSSFCGRKRRKKCASRLSICMKYKSHKKEEGEGEENKEQFSFEHFSSAARSLSLSRTVASTDCAK